MASRKKQSVRTPDEQEADEYRALTERAYINTPPPNRQYQIGDDIIVGALDKCIVTKVFDEGKIIKLHCWYTDNNYGRPVKCEKDMLIPWHHGVRRSDVVAKKQHDDEYRRIQYSTSMIESLICTYYHSGLDLNPPYQRGIVWTDDMKVALIESVFNDVDIGKFVIARRDWGTQNELYEIVDGKQRFTALMEFYESRFRWRGYYYHQLHMRDQNYFDNYPVASAQIDVPTEEQLLKIFLKLNTTGVPMDPAHLERVRKMLEAK